MSNIPLMPKATAVWLIDNTNITFEQIADFCHLHILEVQSIADGDIAQNIMGKDPVLAGQLDKDDIEKAQKDPNYKLKLTKPKIDISSKVKSKRRYTPLSLRQNRPDAIYWLLVNHPELTDAKIIKLIGTTKNTIDSIKNKTHWNFSNIKAVDPVALGLCRQIDLDHTIAKMQSKAPKQQQENENVETVS